MSKLIPILFSTPMVVALLEGSKTQTRRLVKDEHDSRGLRTGVKTEWENWHGKPVRCRYGTSGDTLWVRETYRRDYFESGKHAYRADWDHMANEPMRDGCVEPKWTPNIHMKADACRLFLTNKGVRFERLLDITDEDALKEGIIPFTKDGKLTKYWISGDEDSGIAWANMPRSPREAYFMLWDKINGHDSHKANPLVWVIDFEVSKLISILNLHGKHN